MFSLILLSIACTAERKVTPSEPLTTTAATVVAVATDPFKCIWQEVGQLYTNADQETVFPPEPPEEVVQLFKTDLPHVLNLQHTEKNLKWILGVLQGIHNTVIPFTPHFQSNKTTSIYGGIMCVILLGTTIGYRCKMNSFKSALMEVQQNLDQHLSARDPVSGFTHLLLNSANIITNEALALLIMRGHEITPQPKTIPTLTPYIDTQNGMGMSTLIAAWEKEKGRAITLYEKRLLQSKMEKIQSAIEDAKGIATSRDYWIGFFLGIAQGLYDLFIPFSPLFGFCENTVLAYSITAVSVFFIWGLVLRYCSTQSSKCLKNTIIIFKEHKKDSTFGNVLEAYIDQEIARLDDTKTIKETLQKYKSKHQH